MDVENNGTENSTLPAKLSPHGRMQEHTSCTLTYAAVTAHTHTHPPSRASCIYYGLAGCLEKNLLGLTGRD